MKLFYLFFVVLALSNIVVFPQVIHAQSQTINATIRISICGDGVAENPEECDNSDLDGQTCQTQGFGPGTLSCDIGCDLDVTACSPAPVVATSSATTTTSESDTETDSDESDTLISQILNNSTLTSTSAGSVAEVTSLTPVLPQVLQLFYIDPDGTINIETLPEKIELWTDAWINTVVQEDLLPEEQQKCDVNLDGKCDLKDLSVLLYYIER